MLEAPVSLVESVGWFLHPVVPLSQRSWAQWVLVPIGNWMKVHLSPEALRFGSQGLSLSASLASQFCSFSFLSLCWATCFVCVLFTLLCRIVYLCFVVASLNFVQTIILNSLTICRSPFPWVWFLINYGISVLISCCLDFFVFPVGLHLCLLIWWCSNFFPLHYSVGGERPPLVVGARLGCGHSGSGEGPAVLVSVQLLHLKSVSAKISGVLNQPGWGCPKWWRRMLRNSWSLFLLWSTLWSRGSLLVPSRLLGTLLVVVALVSNMWVPVEHSQNRGVLYRHLWSDSGTGVWVIG